MAKQRRLAAAILAVFVLVAVMTSLFIMAHEVDHDCTGEDCPVCAVIALCRNALKVLCGTLIAAALLFACLRFTAPILLPIRVSSYSKTPITLKVKLLN
ncbi:MAG: hypothetical protein IJG45_06725 [Oscillospiraceae bacterium]|nr:hypothetical protein [Oscillospiraceae bacterium]